MDIVLKQLRSDIEYKFGQAINSKTSSIALSDSIFEQCGDRVSYNTIRRFFGLTETVVPRSSTLDILARYVGASDFVNYRLKGAQEKELLEQSTNYSGTLENSCGWDYIKLAAGILKSSNDRLKWHTLGLILRNLFIGKHFDKVKEILALEEWDNMRDFNQLDLMNKHLNDIVLDLDDEGYIVEWIKHTNYVRVILSFHVDQGGVYPKLMKQFEWVFKLAKNPEEKAYAGSVLCLASLVNEDWERFQAYYQEIQHFVDRKWYGFLMNRLYTLEFVYQTRFNKQSKKAELQKLIDRNLEIDQFHGKWTNESMVAACIAIDDVECLEKYLDIIQPTEKQGQRFFYETEIGNWHLVGRMFIAKQRGEDTGQFQEQLQLEQLSLQKHKFFNFMLRKIGMPEIESFPYGTISCRLI